MWADGGFPGVQDSLDQADPNLGTTVANGARADRSLSGVSNFQPLPSKRNVGEVFSQRSAAPRLEMRVARYVLGVTLGALVIAAPLSFVGSEVRAAQVMPHASSTTAGTYVPLNPVRITDTRSGSPYPNAGKKLGSTGSLNVQVEGSGGVPLDGVSAAVLNVTVVAPTAESYFAVFPEGTTRPAISNLHFTTNAISANLVTVPLGNQGGVTIFNAVGSANVLVDVEGYYTTSPGSTGLYDPLVPYRILGNLEAGATVGPGTSTPVRVAGIGGVPDQVSAIVANVTVADSTGSGYLTLFAAPDLGSPSPPPVSDVNFTTGQIVSNRVIVPVGANGAIEVYNPTGSAQVDVDLDGYYTRSAGQLGSAFTPLGPTRFTDTLVGVNGTPISSGSSQSFNFLSDGIPAKAVALASNVTIAAGGADGHVTIYSATDSTPPPESDLTFTEGGISQTFVQAPLNESSTEIFSSSADDVNVLVDAVGYFAPPPPSVAVVAGPSTLAADGFSRSALTVTVGNGSGVAFNDPVTLAWTPSVAGSCGIASATGNTNAQGQVTSTYTASTTPGLCTITATEANGGTTGSITITQTGQSQAAPPQAGAVRVTCAVVNGPASTSSAHPTVVVCCAAGPLARKCTAARRR